MEKVSRILAVAERPDAAATVLDKAVSLARCFGARVDLLITEAMQVEAFATLCGVMGYADVTLVSVHTGSAPMHEIILRRMGDRRADLVVKSPSRPRPIHGLSLADSDWELVNECPVPVLLVRQAPWSMPVRLAAAVDVSDRDTSDVTRAILDTAGFLAMGLHGNLDVLYSERERDDERERTERAVRLAQLVREFHVGCEKIQVHSGDPEKVLPPLAAARQYDILVLGSVSRRQGFRRGFGGTTGRMIGATHGDVMLVSAPFSNVEREEYRDQSVREQRSDELEQFV